jgi:membrane protease YdiL (CAAX protease family)
MTPSPRPDLSTAAPAASTPAPRGTALFFIAALGFTWLLQLPAVLAQRGVVAGPVDRFMPLAALGSFGPLLAAVVVSRFGPGGGGVRALFRPLRTWRVGAVWYLVALGLFAAIHVAGTAVYTLFGGSDAGSWLYLPENGQHVAAMILIPIAEEPGWRGFALPRLQERYSALKASLLLGVGWALWHTMMFVLQGTSPFTFAVSMVNILAGSVIFSWIYNRTRGSLLIAILAHVGAHLDNPTRALPGNATPFVVYTVAICVAAIALVVGDRRVWRDPYLVPRGRT